MSRAGIVLCGGRSSRMGRAKAWLPWFGQTMIEHVVAQLASVVDEVVVVTSAALDLPPLPARIVRDREPERGPLAGIRDGLAAVDSEYAFVTSTDAPFLTETFVSRMLSEQTACAPLAEGHVQVLCAVYPRTGWREASRLLDAGVGRPLGLLEALGFKTIDFDPGEGPPPWHGFNTPGAYLEVVRALDPTATAEIEFVGRAAEVVDPPLHRVAIGTLGEILGRMPWPGSGQISGHRAPASSALIEGGEIAPAWLVSLGGREFVRSLSVPVGPGERVRVLDAKAGD